MTNLIYDTSLYPNNVDSKFLEISTAWANQGGQNTVNLTPIHERYYVVWKYAQYLSDLNGDFVECGAYSGSTSNFMASECKTTLHLFDSWQGLSDMSEHDNPLYYDPAHKWPSPKFTYDINKTKDNLKHHTNIMYHEGWIPDSLTIDSNISFLHLDLAVYQPTRDSLEYFWDKMVEGGVVIVDTHDGWSTGAQKAMEDFFSRLRTIEMLPTGKAVIIK